jgi:hypothetical protein
MNGEGVEWVLENISSLQTLGKWCLGLQADVYDGTGTGAKNHSGLMLEEYLNSMVMVAAGKNCLLSTPPTTGDGGGITQGCLVQRASVPLEIILLFAAVNIGVVAMAVYIVILSRAMKSPSSGLSCQRVDGDHPDKIQRETPNDLLGWIAQFVREGVRGVSVGMINRENLRFWSFGSRENRLVSG